MVNYGIWVLIATPIFISLGLFLSIYVVFKLRLAKENRVAVKTTPILINMLNKINLHMIIEEANNDSYGIKNELKSYLVSKNESDVYKMAKKVNIGKLYDNTYADIFLGIFCRLRPPGTPDFAFYTGIFVKVEQFETLIMRYAAIREWFTLFRVGSIYMQTFGNYVFSGFVMIDKPSEDFGEMISMFKTDVNNSSVVKKSYGNNGMVFSKYLVIVFSKIMPVDMYLNFVRRNRYTAFGINFRLKFVGNGNFNEEKFTILDTDTGFENAKYSEISFMILENLNYVEESLWLLLKNYNPSVRNKI